MLLPARTRPLKLHALESPRGNTPFLEATPGAVCMSIN
jgi:hypothetical protein